jgi:hypothetical protein
MVPSAPLLRYAAAMGQPDASADIGYKSAQEFWDEIVLASASRMEAQPTRAHAMACAIYISHFLDWVFAEQHPDDAIRNSNAYAAFKKQHHTVCAELAWLVDLAEAPGRRGAVSLRQSTKDAASPLELALPDGTHRPFNDVVANAIAYWRANR